MRQIILDTETTGLEPRLGHRIIELAGVELVNRRLTGNHFHCYLNPDREVDEGAMQVHGITSDFLEDKPRFGDVVGDFLDYIRGAELVIHNAPFDTGFLNSELDKLGLPPITQYCSAVVDTLAMAREMRPGQRNSLDALCKHYGVDNSNRTLHGALLDCELLGAVYLAMTRGQESLMMVSSQSDSTESEARSRKPRPRPLRIHVPENELAEHNALLDAINRESQGACLWLAGDGESD
ncbi:MAG: DNA polymerase III subunit epsilon [Thiobacillaceae bacterium]|jgi:DNA polymerase-3 subunit epsilon